MNTDQWMLVIVGGGSVLLILIGLWLVHRFEKRLPRDEVVVESEPGPDDDDPGAYAELGTPELRVYDPRDFEYTLRCKGCDFGIRPGAEYYEVPLPRARRAGAMFAVCVSCTEAPNYRVAR